jgi:HD-GYP domain-containing protein (c-di-GMP phosphodiesterase class II)
VTVKSFPSDHSQDFVAVDLRGFTAGRPPLLDIYHHVRDQYVLYCEAHAVFSEAARLRLISAGTVTLYVRVTRAGVDSGGADLPSLLSLPDAALAQSVKSVILYKSALNTTQSLYESRMRPENIDTAVQYVGLVTMHLSSNPDAFTSVVELMDHGQELYIHAVNVCTFAVALGADVGLVKPVLMILGTSALVHDVGMTRVPPRIREKADALTAEEMAVIRRHPDWSAQLVGAVVGEDDLMTSIVRSHHERLDGGGYPRGLAGARIDTPTRIVSLANVYEALTSHRAYRGAYTPFQALDIMRRMTGQLDPDLFLRFVHLLGRGAR